MITEYYFSTKFLIRREYIFISHLYRIKRYKMIYAVRIDNYKLKLRGIEF